MKKVIRLNESELVSLINRIIIEGTNPNPLENFKECFDNNGIKIDSLLEDCKKALESIINAGPTKTPNSRDFMSCGFQMALKIPALTQCIFEKMKQTSKPGPMY